MTAFFVKIQSHCLPIRVPLAKALLLQGSSTILRKDKVIKKLDILIIRSFIGPFYCRVCHFPFVLTMQFFWLYIDDLVGKGLDLFIILKLVGLVTCSGFPWHCRWLYCSLPS
jgi:hypothetical protein